MGRPSQPRQVSRLIFSIIFALGLTFGATGSALSSDYRLLSFDGVPVKWGDSRVGTPARVTWALQSGERFDRRAINCKYTRDLDKLLARAGVSEEEFLTQTEVAFAMWEAAANIEFVQAAAGETPDIVIGAQVVPRGIAWTDLKLVGGFQPRDLSEKSAAGEGVADRLKSASICLNPNQDWQLGFDGNVETYDIRHVLAHEIGHALGLDHPGKEGPVMGFSYQEGLTALTPGDIAGVSYLYGHRFSDNLGLSAPSH